MVECPHLPDDQADGNGRIDQVAGDMPRRVSLSSDSRLSRERTANLLKELRQAGRESRMLKARIERAEAEATESSSERAARLKENAGRKRR